MVWTEDNCFAFYTSRGETKLGIVSNAWGYENVFFLWAKGNANPSEIFYLGKGNASVVEGMHKHILDYAYITRYHGICMISNHAEKGNTQ